MDIETHLEHFLDHFNVLRNEACSGRDGFGDEFQSLVNETIEMKENGKFPVSEGEKEHNRRRNRYKDILPFDHTRVKLKEIVGTPGSDYINANFIKGASGHNTYIATQGPLPYTLNDFWRMLWEKNVHVVIMTCNEVENGKTKCERYWALAGEEKTCGNITVTTHYEEISEEKDFFIRDMKATCDGNSRIIRQFHYLVWPDHGVPDSVTTMLNMIELARVYQPGDSTPIVVHCSAGCGRTGTICAIDYSWSILKQGKLDSDFQLYNIIGEMRKQRLSMVQHRDQYFVVYKAVAELFKNKLEIINQHDYQNLKDLGIQPKREKKAHGSEKEEKQAPKEDPYINEKVLKKMTQAKDSSDKQFWTNQDKPDLNKERPPSPEESDYVLPSEEENGKFVTRVEVKADVRPKVNRNNQEYSRNSHPGTSVSTSGSSQSDRDGRKVNSHPGTSVSTSGSIPSQSDRDGRKVKPAIKTKPLISPKPGKDEKQISKEQFFQTVPANRKQAHEKAKNIKRNDDSYLANEASSQYSQDLITLSDAGGTDSTKRTDFFPRGRPPKLPRNHLYEDVDLIADAESHTSAGRKSIAVKPALNEKSNILQKNSADETVGFKTENKRQIKLELEGMLKQPKPKDKNITKLAISEEIHTAAVVKDGGSPQTSGKLTAGKKSKFNIALFSKQNKSLENEGQDAEIEQKNETTKKTSGPHFLKNLFHTKEKEENKKQRPPAELPQVIKDPEICEYSQVNQSENDMEDLTDYSYVDAKEICQTIPKGVEYSDPIDTSLQTTKGPNLIRNTPQPVQHTLDVSDPQNISDKREYSYASYQPQKNIDVSSKNKDRSPKAPPRKKKKVPTATLR